MQLILLALWRWCIRWTRDNQSFSWDVLVYRITGIDYVHFNVICILTAYFSAVPDQSLVLLPPRENDGVAVVVHLPLHQGLEAVLHGHVVVQRAPVQDPGHVPAQDLPKEVQGRGGLVFVLWSELNVFVSILVKWFKQILNLINQLLQLAIKVYISLKKSDSV